MNRQPVECEKIFTNHRCNKGLTAKLYKELIQLSSKKKITQRKMGKGHEQTFFQIDIQMAKRYGLEDMGSGKGKLG